MSKAIRRQVLTKLSTKTAPSSFKSKPIYLSDRLSKYVSDKIIISIKRKVVPDSLLEILNTKKILNECKNGEMEEPSGVVTYRSYYFILKRKIFKKLYGRIRIIIFCEKNKDGFKPFSHMYILNKKDHQRIEHVINKECNRIPEHLVDPES
jgi:hypothetical protein